MWRIWLTYRITKFHNLVTDPGHKRAKANVVDPTPKVLARSEKSLDQEPFTNYFFILQQYKVPDLNSSRIRLKLSDVEPQHELELVILQQCNPAERTLEEQNESMFSS
jgi:hypothetical protein